MMLGACAEFINLMKAVGVQTNERKRVPVPVLTLSFLAHQLTQLTADASL